MMLYMGTLDILPLFPLSKRTSMKEKYILGYNEPNFSDQANLTPQAAASDWPNLERVANKYPHLYGISPVSTIYYAEIWDEDWKPFSVVRRK